MNLVVQINLGRESLSKLITTVFVEQPQAKPVCLLSIHCQFSDIDELWDFVNSIFGIIHGLMNKRLSENMAKSFNTCRESFYVINSPRMVNACEKSRFVYAQLSGDTCILLRLIIFKFIFLFFLHVTISMHNIKIKYSTTIPKVRGGM